MNAVTVASVPGIVAECELTEPLRAIAAPAAGAPMLLLVRAFGEPIGLLSRTLTAEGLSAEALARAIEHDLRGALTEVFAAAGLPWTSAVPVGGLSPAQTPAYVTRRQEVLRDGPEITVAVCTRDRTEDLKLLLDSLADQAYRRFRLLVVDNAPSDDGTRRLVAERADAGLDIEYAVEPRPGLSWARNTVIALCTTEILAFADDDEVCDHWWAAELVRAFLDVPEAGAVSGLVMPAELQTPSQALFEQYSGVQRGRGFRRMIFSPATAHEQSPLYPLPPYGVGANMAFRIDALKRISGFDTALGAGTPTLAGEDTAALSAILLDGGTIVYAPAAIVRHRHRRDMEALRKVMLGYGRGLSAFYASVLMQEPRYAADLLRLSHRALRGQFARSAERQDELAGFPRDLLRLHRKGLLQGAFMYPGARRQARRLAAAGSR